ncbi:MAG: hypothetical protein ACRCX2_22880 [Paraclostridium sp.]
MIYYMSYHPNIQILVSSNPNSGSSNLSNNGSMCELKLSPPIHISQEYKATMRLLKASIWNTIANIDQTLYNNNRIVFNNGGGDLILNLPTGLYSVAGLNTAINDFLVNNGIASGACILNGVEATGNITIQLNVNTLFIKWNLSTIATFLGWTQASANIGPGPANFTYTSPNSANFNSVNTVVIHSSICTGSYFSNRGGSDVIGSVSLTARPGSLNYSEFINPVESLINVRNIDSIIFYLTDENNRAINTGGEFFTLVCEILLNKK